MQTSTWPQSGPDRSVTGQSSSPQVTSGQLSGNPSTYSHQYGPVRPSVAYTLGREVGPAVPYTQGGECLPHSSQVTSVGYWSGQTQNQQAPTKEQALMATSPLLTSLLTNNAAAQSTGVTSQSGYHHTLPGRVNDAFKPTFQQGHGSLGVNSNNSQRLVQNGQGATIHCPSDINASLNTNCIYFQSPASGSQQLVLGRQEGASSGTAAALAMGMSPNHQWTVVSGKDSSRMAVQALHQGYPRTPNSLQSAQETSSVPSRTSPLSPTAYKQLLHLIQNQNNNNRTEMNRVQHGTPVQTDPSNHSQMYPFQPLTDSNNQVNLPNATVGQSMPMHNISQNPQYNVMHNPSLNNFQRYRPAGLTNPPQQNRLVSNCANMNSQAGAIENNAHHAPYPRPHIEGVSNLHYKAGGTYVLASNTGPSSSVPNDSIQSSVEHTRESAPPPYPGQHSHGPVLNKTGHVVGAGAHSLQYIPNQGSAHTLHNKPKNAYVLISNTGPSSSVLNHGMQFSGQQNCESVPPSYPIRQGYYVTVTEDKSGNGFRAENVILIGDKPNESALVRQGSSASNALSVPTVQKAIAVVQPLSQRMQTNTSLNVADRIPLTTQGMSFSTGGENVSNPGEESCDQSPSQAKTTLTVSASLTNESGQKVPKVRPEATLESGAERTVPQNSETSDVELAKTYSNFESEWSRSNCLHVEKVDSQPLSNLKCQATQRKELAGREMTTHVHVNQLSEETNEKVVSDEDIFELSSVPVIKWRLGKLKELVDTVQHPKCSETQVESKLLNLYWDGDGQKLIDAARSGILWNIMREVRSVCGDDMSSQSVIFSQVRRKNWAQVEEKCVILKHDSVYPEVPGQESSWLNTNNQLDDIDREFGFPWSLIYDQQTLQRGDEQPKRNCTENENSSDSASDMQTEVIQTERPAPSESDPKEIQGSSLAQRSTHTLSPVKKESENILFCDPFSSLEINVLPPEEAMRFFNGPLLQDKVGEDQLKLPVDVELNELKDYSVEDKSSEGVDVKLTTVKYEVDVQSEDYCCLSRWKAVFSGSTNSVSCKCQYKAELGLTKATVNAKMFVEGTLAVEPSTTNAEQRESLHLCKSYGTAEGEREGNPGKNGNPQSWESTDIECQTFVLSDSESETDRPYTNGAKSLPLSKPPSLCLPIKCPNIIEVEIEDVFSSYEDFLKVSTPMSELVWDNVQPKQQLPGPLQKQMECVQALSVTLEERVLGGSEVSPTVTIPTSNLLRQPAEKISFLTSLSLAQRCHKHLSPKLNCSCKVKQKGVGHKRCVEGPHSKLSVPRKRRKMRQGLGPFIQLVPEVNLTDTDDDFEPPNTSASNSLEEERPSNSRNLQKPAEPGIGTKISRVTTVSLALFGSSPQRTNGTVVTGQRKDHNSSRPRPFADEAPAPPITLSVNVKSWRIEPSETSPPVESPVRQRLFNDWENSFVPTKKTKSRGRASRLRNRRGFAPKIVCAEVAKNTVTSTSTDGSALSSERRTTPERTVRAKQTLRHIERERILNGLKLRLKKSRIKVVPSSKPDTVEKSTNKIRSPALLPLEENSVLRFSVLPESFNFKDDSTSQTGSMKEMAGADAVATTTESPKTIVRKSQVGLWSAGPQKRYCPLTSSTTKVPKSSSTAFQEFQMKFKRLSQD
ncbi:uncharacterized protein si:ch211-106e7.2 isoform X1 [Salvelinus fontinalis]|uniref:uncharacterized protein si:ch211-106e7.2 isoform X1 n=1 Tax=Salvelinus fontinalis TaxID=8038 RepID=UPI00248616F0|nr:uncharacterized protein si:ch211-106e7.2 isoform X1 [Salvelinus fontinalis]XP_055778289.1 uncharacterized protein si:ch211-106e7.2 isoform X1 [Salvelinus fontinalis]XP_055778290.1 uncharacterized protein si:ch211-106e7.2 isoform X1 [Salvelinus fontinalis]XP_055778291.1 uncharacterized protein si:ch211-106e7.2 isoform X1 [Salvelinus fontinalis]XP_055778292.1 uncharacterized protein si:ch211-106e7.2 isoform X1 [Salvelinus fontinalis]XP_055778293.1 uncharacterized protein si:ch211-106e7.2 isof